MRNRSVRRGLQDFARVGTDALGAIAGDLREPSEARRTTIQRHLMAESMTDDRFCTILEESGAASAERARALLAGENPSNEEQRGEQSCMCMKAYVEGGKVDLVALSLCIFRSLRRPARTPFT